MSKRPYPTWRRRHEGVLLWLMRNPGGKIKDCARDLGYSPSQVSRIINSPDFKRAYRHALKVGRREALEAWFN